MIPQHTPQPRRSIHGAETNNHPVALGERAARGPAGIRVRIYVGELQRRRTARHMHVRDNSQRVLADGGLRIESGVGGIRARRRIQARRRRRPRLHPSTINNHAHAHADTHADTHAHEWGVRARTNSRKPECRVPEKNLRLGFATFWFNLFPSIFRGWG